MAEYGNFLHDEIADWEDLEDIDIRGRTRMFKNRRDPFESYLDHEFIQRFRLSKTVALDLLARIQHLLPDSATGRGLRIPPRLQLLVTLRYYATGSFQLDMGDCCDMSQPCVSVCVKNVTRAICQLAREFIKFPSPAEEQEVMRNFGMIADMPGVVGCVDGVHIPIISPGGPNVELYRCRKGFFSLNVMGVCDASMLFTNLVVNWQGSAHDARIFNESALRALLERGQYKGYLLGDSGYPCKSYLLTPLRDPRTVKERRYNTSHIKTRNLIERTFEIWKKRFSVLSKPMRTALPNSQRIVTACAILHNICILNRLPVDEVDDLDEQHIVDEFHDNEVGPGNARRANIIERFF